MCGIIGILGSSDVADRLVDGLRRLEYRGYDSAGVATVDAGHIVRRRAAGKLHNLARVLATEPVGGHVGIAHTRWATHGAPTTENAHPHATPQVALIHNGIIENFATLRAEVLAAGRVLESETDSEVVAHLISARVEAGASPRDAVAAVLPTLRGAFALAILFRDHPDLLIGARRGSPLVVGFGDGEAYLGSDALALAPLTQRITYLDEGDWVVLSRDAAAIYDAAGNPVERPVTISAVSGALVDKGNHRHFMRKEMFEQPIVIAQTLGQYLRLQGECVRLPDAPFPLADTARVILVACGTAAYAGMVARDWIEAVARVPASVEVASEFRYRDPVLNPDDLVVLVSQSGETADTLAAMRHAKAAGARVAAVVNVASSSMAREVDLALPTFAGPEIGVASTKAFTCQLAVLAAFAIGLGVARGVVDREEERRLVRLLEGVPALVNEALGVDDHIAEIALRLSKARDILYLGRGTACAIALEGALKLKEISYIHAAGHAAGELKHGAIALIDELVPSVFLAPSGPLFEKTASNLSEVHARGGPVLLVSDAAGIAAVGDKALASVQMPATDPFVAPIVYAVPVQLLAYHVAVAKGTDVDQPRNLAKSVTVE